jgi:hypothetical protein
MLVHACGIQTCHPIAQMAYDRAFIMIGFSNTKLPNSMFHV